MPVRLSILRDDSLITARHDEARVTSPRPQLFRGFARDAHKAHGKASAGLCKQKKLGEKDTFFPVADQRCHAARLKCVQRNDSLFAISWRFDCLRRHCGLAAACLATEPGNARDLPELFDLDTEIALAFTAESRGPFYSQSNHRNRDDGELDRTFEYEF